MVWSCLHGASDLCLSSKAPRVTPPRAGLLAQEDSRSQAQPRHTGPTHSPTSSSHGTQTRRAFCSPLRANARGQPAWKIGVPYGEQQEGIFKSSLF